MKTLIRQLVPLAFVTAIAVCGTASAATLTVTSAADDGGGDTLRDAIAAAQPGDTIVFDPALNGSTIVLTSGSLLIDQSLDIEGPGADLLAISGNRTSNVISADGTGPVTIAGLTIQDGGNFYGGESGGYSVGGGIYNAVGGPDAPGVFLTLRACTITGNAAAFGGGIANNRNLVISGCTLSGNRVVPTLNNLWEAIGAGAGLWNAWAGSAVITDNSIVSDNFVDCSAGGTGGGGIYNNGLLDIRDSTVSNNTAQYGDGGGILNDWFLWGIEYYTPTLTMTNCTVSGNTAESDLVGGQGGGICNEVVATLDTCLVSGNIAGWRGGGIFNDSTADLTLIHSSVSHNKPDNLYNLATVTKTSGKGNNK